MLVCSQKSVMQNSISIQRLFTMMHLWKVKCNDKNIGKGQQDEWLRQKIQQYNNKKEYVKNAQLFFETIFAGSDTISLSDSPSNS